MTPAAAQSLAAALAAFIAVTPFAGHDDNTSPDGRDKAHAVVRGAPHHAALAGIGMPDTGPGNVALKPLTVIVNVAGTNVTSRLRAEIGQLGDWLSIHHGRARVAFVNGQRTTGLVEPSTIEQAPATRSIRSLASYTGETFSGRTGQRLLVTIGPRQAARPLGAASLWLPIESGAPIVDGVALHDQQTVEQPVDAQRRGVIAATAARAVISLARLREIPSGASR